jgi:hypothetical protein
VLGNDPRFSEWRERATDLTWLQEHRNRVRPTRDTVFAAIDSQIGSRSPSKLAIAEAARWAGLSRPTIYKLFGNVEGLRKAYAEHSESESA